MIGDRIKQVLQDNGVEYKEYGESSNVARGNINVHCPFCGSDDHSEHLGINLATGIFGCWKSKAHSGKNPAYLIAKLVGTTVGHAKEMLGIFTDVSALASVASGEVFEMPSKKERHSRMDGEDHFIAKYKLRLIKPTTTTARHFKYLKLQRGFSERGDVLKIVRQYGLYGATSGHFRHRVVFTVSQDGKVVNLTGRSIYKDAELRYLSLGSDEVNVPIHDCLYNEAKVGKGGSILLCHEGPMDVIKTDFYAKEFGIRSVGLFNMNLTEVQQERLYVLSKSFDRMMVSLDSGFVKQAYDLLKYIVGRSKVEVVYEYPGNAEDPGAMTPEQVRDFCRQLLGMSNHGQTSTIKAT